MNPVRKLFLDDRFVLGLIMINAILIFIQAFPEYSNNRTLLIMDNTISVLFLFELINKSAYLGVREYLKSNWNKFDVVLVLISLPSLLVDFLPEGSMAGGLSTLLVLRVFRVFKFFRVLKFFPKVEQIFKAAGAAVQSSGVVLAGFFVYIFIVSLLCCYLFRDIAVDAFGNPFSAYYSTFQVFTIEGWYDIPKAIVEQAEASGNALSTTQVFFLRLFYMTLLIIGGIFGLSIVNALFVDTMLSGTNEEMEDNLATLGSEFHAINVKIDNMLAIAESPDFDIDYEDDTMYR
jgi:voltage-gated sodium channel